MTIIFVAVISVLVLGGESHTFAAVAYTNTYYEWWEEYDGDYNVDSYTYINDMGGVRYGPDQTTTQLLPTPLSIATTTAAATYHSAFGQITPKITFTTMSENSSATKSALAIPVLTNLTAPWDVAFGNDGWMYVSTRPGVLYGVHEGNMTELLRLRVSGGEGGMLGVAALENMVYVYHTDPEGGNKVSRYIHGESGLTFNTTIIDNIPAGAYHDGGRIKFGPDSMLYVTTGDAGRNVNSWIKDSLAGKILRIAPNGSIPQGNPFPNSPVYAYGLRNPQGLAWDNTGTLYVTDHGATGQDEINRIIPGGNYGWPFARGDSVLEGTIPPLIHSGNDTWAPSGLVFAKDGTPQVGGMLLYGALRGEHLGAVQVDGTGHTMLFDGDLGRIRTPIQHPNGTLYLLTSNNDGRGTPNEGDDKLLRIEFPDPIQASITSNTPTAGEDITVTISLDTAAPADNQFIVQLHPCNDIHGNYHNLNNLCPDGDTITYDDIVPVRTSTPIYHGDPQINYYDGILTIKNGTTTGTISFSTVHDGDLDPESLIISVIPRVERQDGGHPFYSLYDLLELRWVDSSTTPAVGNIHGFVLWKTSILPSPDPPKVASISGMISLTENDDVTFFIDVKPPPSSPLDVKYTVSQVGSFVNSSYVGSHTVSVPTSGTVSVTLPVIDNNIADEQDGTVTITLNEGSGYTPLSSQKTLLVDIVNDDDGKPMSVSINAQKTSILTNGVGTNFTINLDRPLEPGETVTTPFVVNGGTTPEHWSIRLSGDNRDEKLGGTIELTSLNGGVGGNFNVTFSKDARTATLVLAAGQSNDAIGRNITVSLGPPTSTGVEGGVILDKDTSFTVNIKDGGKPAPTISILGDNPTYISEGEQPYTDAGATCVDHSGKSLTPVVVSSSVNMLVPGTYAVSYSCTDDIGKKSSADRTIIVQDVMPPSLLIQNVKVEATGPTTSVALGFPVIYDTSGGPFTITHNATGSLQTTVITTNTTDNVMASFAVGNHIVQWSATDTSDNTGIVNQVVLVEDTMPPSLLIPNVKVEATGPTTSVTLGLPVIHDTSGGPFTITHNATGSLQTVTTTTTTTNTTDNVMASFAVGNHIVQWSATDTSDNTGIVNQVVLVEDTIPPVLALKGSTPVVVTVNSQYVDAGATCTDNVDGTLVPIMQGSVNTSNVGSYIIHYVCSDTQNNAATQISRTVSVIVDDDDNNGDTPSTNQADIVQVYNDKSVLVTLDAKKTAIEENKDKTRFMIKLSRTLGPGETITVPFDVQGATLREHFSIKLGGSNDGVEYKSSNSKSEPATAVFTQGSKKATFVITAKPNSDTVDRTITVSLLDAPTSVGVSEGVALYNNNNSISIDIIDDDKPVSVSLETQKTAIGENRGKAKFTIELSRTLGPGETITVPFDVQGATLREHFSIKLGENNDGVEYKSSSSKSEPATAVFTQGSKKATFVITAKPNSDTVDRTITVSLLDAPTSVGVSGGTILNNSNHNAIAIDIIDDEKYLSASLDAQKTSIPENGGKTKIKVTLNRQLETDETVGVGFDVKGGTAYDHWYIGLRDGKGTKQIADAGKSEVWYNEDGSLYALIVMDGVHGATAKILFTEGQQSATFLLTARPNNDTKDRTLTVSPLLLSSSGITQRGVILGYDTSFVCSSTCNLRSLAEGGFEFSYDDASFQINIINDDEKPTDPTINVHGDNPTHISEGEQPYTDAGVTCIDYNGKSITPVVVSSTVNTLVPGTYAISYSCTDDAGRNISADRTIIVQDVIPPSLLISNVKVEATGPTTSVALGFPAIHDTSEGPFTITHNATGSIQTIVTTTTTNTTDNVIASFTVGNHTVQWSATDTSGNTGTKSQSILVSDTTPPTLTLNGKALVHTFVENTYTDAGATCIDSVDGVLEPIVQSNLNTTSAGQYSIKYTCSDTRGNAAEPVSRIISIGDITPPSLLISNVKVESTGPTTSVALGLPVVQDASGGPFFIIHNATGSLQTVTTTTDNVIVSFAVGSHIVQWNATDISGNTGTVNQVVLVEDTTPPSLLIPNVKVEATGPTTSVALGFPVVQDASGGPFTITHNATGSLQTIVTTTTNTTDNVIASSFTVGNHTVQWSATDTSDNTGTKSQSIFVSDTTPPTLTLNGKASLFIPMGETYTDAGATCTDSVDGAIKPTVNGSVNVSVRDTYKITYMCTDMAGNVATAVTRTVQLTLPNVIPTAFVVGDMTATEGNDLDFIISLNHPYARAVDVYYITIDVEAVAGSDYTFDNDLVRFEPGQTTHTVSVNTTTDSIQEGDEKMRLEIVAADNAEISADMWLAIGTISDP